MKKSRRNFLQWSLVSSLGAMIPFNSRAKVFGFSAESLVKRKGPIALATWRHGLAANEEAWKIMQGGGKAIDAVEAGVMVVENDPECRSVGLGGYPDREGNVTLDACIMDENQRCGSVAFLQHIKNPIAVARKVMEGTPHIMIVGEGALQFALQNGFKKENLLTEDTLRAWKEMYKTEEIQSLINIENHDTIGMITMDATGDFSGACTTSGSAFKMYGRVGDSPIIGAGLYVDNEVGAATATGWGEEVIRNAGSAMVVEMMRQGRSPQAACEEIVKRIAHKNKDYTKLQVGFLAISKSGAVGAYAIQKGFNYALMVDGKNELVDADSMLK